MNRLPFADRSPEYTKGATGIQVRRGDLVVFWDEVYLRQDGEVDGNIRLVVVRLSTGDLQLWKMFSIPPCLIGPRRGLQSELFVEIAGSNVVVVEDLGVGRVHRCSDLLHRALEISTGTRVEAEHVPISDD